MAAVCSQLARDCRGYPAHQSHSIEELWARRSHIQRTFLFGSARLGSRPTACSPPDSPSQKEYIIRLGEVSLTKPLHTEAGLQLPEALMPRAARLRDLTYSSMMYARRAHGNLRTAELIVFASVPLLLLGQVCGRGADDCDGG